MEPLNCVIEVRPDGKAVLFVVRGQPGADISLELFTALERKGLLEEVFDRPIRVEEAEPATT
jgi:hypothetical protein